MPNVDYRALLKKYIQHVGGCEGVTFLSDHRTPGGYSYQDGFTPEEWAALKALEYEQEAPRRCGQ